MANRNAAFKAVMGELKGKIKEHSASKYNRNDTDDDNEMGDHPEPDGDEGESEDEDEDEGADLEAKEEPMGDDLCSKCNSKMEVKHKYCANCGCKK